MPVSVYKFRNDQTGDVVEYEWDDSQGPFDYTKAVQTKGSSVGSGASLPKPPESFGSFLWRKSGEGLQKLGEGLGTVARGASALGAASPGVRLGATFAGALSQGKLPDRAAIAEANTVPSIDEILQSAGFGLRLNEQGEMQNATDLSLSQFAVPVIRNVANMGAMAAGGYDPYEGYDPKAPMGTVVNPLNKEQERAFQEANPLMTSGEALADQLLKLGVDIADPSALDAMGAFKAAGAAAKMPGVRKLLMGGLAGRGIAGGVEALKSVYDNWENLTPAERTELLAQGVGGGALGALGLKGLKDARAVKEEAAARLPEPPKEADFSVDLEKPLPVEEDFPQVRQITPSEEFGKLSPEAQARFEQEVMRGSEPEPKSAVPEELPAEIPPEVTEALTRPKPGTLERKQANENEALTESPNDIMDMLRRAGEDPEEFARAGFKADLDSDGALLRLSDEAVTEKMDKLEQLRQDVAAARMGDTDDPKVAAQLDRLRRTELALEYEIKTGTSVIGDTDKRFHKPNKVHLRTVGAMESTNKVADNEGVPWWKLDAVRRAGQTFFNKATGRGWVNFRNNAGVAVKGDQAFHDYVTSKPVATVAETFQHYVEGVQKVIKENVSELIGRNGNPEALNEMLSTRLSALENSAVNADPSRQYLGSGIAGEGNEGGGANGLTGIHIDPAAYSYTVVSRAAEKLKVNSVEALRALKEKNPQRVWQAMHDAGIELAAHELVHFIPGALHSKDRNTWTDDRFESLLTHIMTDPKQRAKTVGGSEKLTSWGQRSEVSPAHAAHLVDSFLDAHEAGKAYTQAANQALQKPDDAFYLPKPPEDIADVAMMLPKKGGGLPEPPKDSDAEVPEEGGKLPPPPRPWFKDPNRGILGTSWGLIKAGFTGKPSVGARNVGTGIATTISELLPGQLAAKTMLNRKVKKALAAGETELARQYSADKGFQTEQAMQLFNTRWKELGVDFAEAVYGIATGGKKFKNNPMRERTEALAEALGSVGEAALSRQVKGESNPGEAVRTRAEEIIGASTILGDKLATDIFRESEMRAFGRKWGIDTSKPGWNRQLHDKFKKASAEDRVSILTDLATSEANAARNAWNMRAAVIGTESRRVPGTTDFKEVDRETRLKEKFLGRPKLNPEDVQFGTRAGLMKAFSSGVFGEDIAPILGSYFMNSRFANMLPSALELMPGLHLASARANNSLKYERVRTEHREISRNQARVGAALQKARGELKALRSSGATEDALRAKQKEIATTEAAHSRLSKTVENREQFMAELRKNGIYRPEDVYKRMMIGPLAMVAGYAWYANRNEEERKLKAEEILAKKGKKVIDWGSNLGYADPAVAVGYNLAKMVDQRKKERDGVQDPTDRLTLLDIFKDAAGRAVGNRYNISDPAGMVLTMIMSPKSIKEVDVKKTIDSWAFSQGEAPTQGGLPRALVEEFTGSEPRKTYSAKGRLEGPPEGIAEEALRGVKDVGATMSEGFRSGIPGASDDVPFVQDFAEGKTYPKETYGEKLKGGAERLQEGDTSAGVLRVFGANEKENAPLVKLLRENSGVISPATALPAMTRDRKLDDILAKVWREEHLENMTLELQDMLDAGIEDKVELKGELSRIARTHNVEALRDAIAIYKDTYPNLPLPLSVQKGVKSLEERSRSRSRGRRIGSPYEGLELEKE